MKKNMYAKLLLIALLIGSLISCYQKKVLNDIPDSNIEALFIDANILTIEEMINNSNKQISGKEFIPGFLTDIWSCNLPINSSTAISNGYAIISRTNTSSDKDNWTYAGRYGFTEEVQVSNSKTNILYWENENESKIWSFSSTDTEIEINGMIPIGKDFYSIVSLGSLPSAITGNVVEYENNDFLIKLVFEKGLCIRVEFENFI